MAKIAKPRQELWYLWRKAGIRGTRPDITRAYHRLNGKFVPIGWYLEDRRGKSMLVTDIEVDNVDFFDRAGFD